MKAAVWQIICLQVKVKDGQSEGNCRGENHKDHCPQKQVLYVEIEHLIHIFLCVCVCVWCELEDSKTLSAEQRTGEVSALSRQP